MQKPPKSAVIQKQDTNSSKKALSGHTGFHPAEHGNLAVLRTTTEGRKWSFHVAALVI